MIITPTPTPNPTTDIAVGSLTQNPMDPNTPPNALHQLEHCVRQHPGSTMLIAALAPTVSQIGQCDCPLIHLAPKNPATIAPRRGNSGIR